MSWRTNEYRPVPRKNRPRHPSYMRWHYRPSETRDIIYVYNEVINDFKEKMQ